MTAQNGKKPFNPAVRLGICAKCPHFNKTAQLCRKCGCRMKTKVLDGRAKCPLGKW